MGIGYGVEPSLKVGNLPQSGQYTEASIAVTSSLSSTSSENYISLILRMTLSSSSTRASRASQASTPEGLGVITQPEIQCVGDHGDLGLIISLDDAHLP